jgi:glycosyltransferase involved in cell wall biosynthesis
VSILRDYKLGLVARCDNGGLGIETLEFYRALRPEKVLCVCATYENFPERFPGAIVTDLHPTEAQMCQFLDGLDSVLTVETPYNWDLFRAARSFGVRSVLKVNYEWLEYHSKPDLYALPNEWHFEDVPNEKQVIPLPVDLERFQFRQRSTARTFLHVVGHDAGYDRNGTKTLLSAIPQVKAPVQFLIRSQIPRSRWNSMLVGDPGNFDPRVRVFDFDLLDNESLYEQGDVLVVPRRYGGQSLVMDEAAACGMPMVASFMEPQRTLFAGSAVFAALRDLAAIRIKQEVEYGETDPGALAAVIDTLASEYGEHAIPEWSRAGRAGIEARSWQPWIDALRPR